MNLKSLLAAAGKRPEISLAVAGFAGFLLGSGGIPIPSLGSILPARPAAPPPPAAVAAPGSSPAPAAVPSPDPFGDY